MKLYYFSFACFLFLSTFYLKSESPVVNISGYIDSYIALDNDKLANNEISDSRQLTYLNPYKNQLSLNIAQISLETSFKNIRGTFALQTGDFVNLAYGNTRNPILQQANIGYNLFDKFWIDAGYFLTHIGGESVLPKDNWLSSHSIVTLFEPFFQSGIRASYEAEKFNAQLHLLNANGLYEDNNDNKTFGVFLSYKITNNFFVSYANIIGNEEPLDSMSKTLFYNNIVAQYNVSEAFCIKGQFDYATKEKARLDESSNELKNGSLMGVSLTTHYQFVQQFGTTLRFAYTNNEDEVFAPAIKGMAITLGCEYKPTDYSYIRLEGSFINMSDDKFKIFTNNNNEPESSRMEVMLNFGLLLKN